MTDRYTKIILTIIAVALMALVLQHQFNPATAHAQEGKAAQHCVWTYLTDEGRPNLGKTGQVDLQDADWKKVSNEGWHLKVWEQNGTYVFERCE